MPPLAPVTAPVTAPLHTDAVPAAAETPCTCKGAGPDRSRGAGRVLFWLLKTVAPRALAHPRFSALRRFACALHAGHTPTTALVSELNTHGLEPRHVAALTEMLF